jgi:hypothetical protein
MIKKTILTLLTIVLLSACAPAQPAPQDTALADNVPVAKQGQTPIKTAAGEMIYQNAKFVDEVNGTPSLPDCHILLVFLDKSDGSRVDLKRDGAAFSGIFIHGEDGSETLSTMGGFVEGDFAIGFQIPKSVTTYKLVWGDNPEVFIEPES